MAGGHTSVVVVGSLTASAPPLPAVGVAHVQTLVLARPGLGGLGELHGTFKRKGSPNNVSWRRRVVLLRKRDMVAVAEAWSDADTGAWAFTGIDPTELYVVVGLDYTGVFKAVCADPLQLPAPWPT